MRVKGGFWILTGLLISIMGIMAWFVFREKSVSIFLLVEGLTFLTAIYLIIFYRRIVKPLKIIGDGMDLLREQDFSSRLRDVGQRDADRIVRVFNKMMDQLKEERLHLREQNHFLDLLINASPLGLLVMDLDDRIASINPAACRVFGIPSAEDIIGKPLDDSGIPFCEELLKITLNESRTIRLSDANIYKCLHQSFVDRGFQHSFYLIEPLTEEVFRAEKKAYEKVIRMIAHEVNNTTAGITSTLDTLENTFSTMQGSEYICEVLQVSIDRCYGLSHFITNFANVVRIPEPQLTYWDLNEVVTTSKRFMETICRNRNIDILLALPSVPVVVKLDITLFEQVLLNIIKNSAESIGKDGSIRINIKTNPVCLEIADTGKGISKEVESKLFTPFYSSKPNGQGIGLIFIREVLQKHNCAFSLQTEKDGLTYFRIYFK